MCGLLASSYLLELWNVPFHCGISLFVLIFLTETLLRKRADVCGLVTVLPHTAQHAPINLSSPQQLELTWSMKLTCKLMNVKLL